MSDMMVAGLILVFAYPLWRFVPWWIDRTRRFLERTHQSFLMPSETAEAAVVVGLRIGIGLTVAIAVVNLVRAAVEAL
jgi:hypothetical protein